MLFDKNGIYLIPREPDDDYDFAIDIMNGNTASMKEKKYYNLDEALKNGNLFPDLYDQYKNYRPFDLKANTEREKKLLEIQKLDFAINDLNLYLDLNPTDMEAYELIKKYVRSCMEKKDEYSSIYGPLTLDETQNEYEWSKGVWPWEEGGM